MKNNETLKIVMRGLTFVFGVVLLAICYNVLLLPNNLVVSGMSGLSIVFKELFGWNPTVFIYASTIVLLFISYIFLGKETTSYTIVGSLLYPLMISITAPVSQSILKFMDINEYLVIICLAGLLYGVSLGLIYKMGFSTGGGDVIMQILSKYANISTARAHFAYSFIIILLSGCVFGLSALIYALIILVISNALIDKIIVGISNSKVFFIYTEMLSKVKDVIANEYHSGYTILTTKSDIKKKRGEIIMVVIPNREYHAFKQKILEIDPNSFFIINDCYEVNGGTRNKNIPFF